METDDWSSPPLKEMEEKTSITSVFFSFSSFGGKGGVCVGVGVPGSLSLKPLEEDSRCLSGLIDRLIDSFIGFWSNEYGGEYVFHCADHVGPW